jgi:F-type H+-transporting ATPase subunit epsilon
MATFRLEIITPDRVVLDAEVRSVRLPGALGSFGVLPNHARLVSELTVGAIHVTHENGDLEQVATAEGLVRVADNRVTVLADAAERAEEIDVERVQAAIERAKARLAEAGAGGYEEAREALRRAMTRLEVARTKEE